MRTKTINVYTLAELKADHPAAYEKVRQRWIEGCNDIPWSNETMDSLKATIKQAGATLRDWSIGTEAQRSYVKVDVDDYWKEDDSEDGESEVLKDAAWYWENCITLKHKECAAKFGTKFPGACALTGYCADDDFQEAVYKALEQGETLTEALQGLADVASRMMEADLEQQQDEESMEANWGDCEYDDNGDEV